MNFFRSYSARLACAVVAGGLYALAYPPLGWGWLAVPGVGGLILALRGQVGTRARALGMVHGLVAYGVGLSWLLDLFGIFALILWCVLGVFHALFAEMFARAEQRGWDGWKLAVFAACVGIHPRGVVSSEISVDDGWAGDGAGGVVAVGGCVCGGQPAGFRHFIGLRACVEAGGGAGCGLGGDSFDIPWPAGAGSCGFAGGEGRRRAT
jgi:Apolipoprotein N-acyltransferase N-terminal domain